MPNFAYKSEGKSEKNSEKDGDLAAYVEIVMCFLFCVVLVALYSWLILN